MESEISKSRFKAHALEILRRVELENEPAVITDRGRPALIVRKYAPTVPTPLDRLRGSVVRYDTPMEPVDHDSRSYKRLAAVAASIPGHPCLHWPLARLDVRPRFARARIAII